MSLDCLPVELLHRICSLLPLDDRLPFRQTSKRFAVVGAEHFLEEITVVFKCDRFQRVKDISAHPVRKNIKTLCFYGDRFEDKSYDEWDNGRCAPLPHNELIITNDLPDPEIDRSGPSWTYGYTQRGQRAIGRALKKYEAKRKGTYTTSELSAAYTAYRELVRDQKRIRPSERVRKLKTVIVTLGYGVQPHSDINVFPFAEALDHPYGDISHRRYGVRQLSSICFAANRAECQFERLYVADISYEFINQPPRIIAQIKSALHNLRVLTIDFCIYFEMPPNSMNRIQRDMIKQLRAGKLREIIADIPNLGIINLSMPHTDDDMLCAGLDDVVSHSSWPCLREFCISNVHTTEDDLIEFLLSHRGTLRSLSLADAELRVGNWHDCFERIGSKLPLLRWIKLRGDLYSHEAGREFDFDCPRAESRKIAPLRDAVENYILGGGSFPLTRLLPNQIMKYPWEVPGYVRPCSFEDEDGYSFDELLAPTTVAEQEKLG